MGSLSAEVPGRGNKTTHTGDTRLLKGWGGRSGTTIRKMTKPDARKEKIARDSVRTIKFMSNGNQPAS